MSEDALDALDAIAAKLSKPMLECFKRGSDLGCYISQRTVGKALVKRGFAVPVVGHASLYDWTPLGRAVRGYVRNPAETTGKPPTPVA